ncbi:TadE/TadG family type IV pilus assembly protein [Burkholderia sp. 22PA0106]|uniref:TadE/TadG family type IV pilus assembly protein n=1 Tax=Burkholderia sp. 22PA0106 TaxID=3237371 RepID=UPI0039C3A077
MTAIRSARRRRAGSPVGRLSRGFVSMEVAIITPLLFLLLLGFGELYMYLRAVSMVEHTAYVLADSLGQRNQVYNSQTVTDPDNLGSIWYAATLLSSPLSLQTKGGVVITSICDQTTSCAPPSANSPSMASGTPIVYWSAAAPWVTTVKSKVGSSGSSLLPGGWPYRAGDSAVIVEVFLTYRPFLMTAAFWSGAPGTTTIYKRVTVYPRTGKPLPLKTPS